MRTTFDGAEGGRVARRIVGALAILYAALLLPAALWRLSAIGSPFGGGSAPGVLAPSNQMATLGLLLVTPALYWATWWLARHSRGSWALLAAAVTVSLDSLVVGLATLIPTGVSPMVASAALGAGIASVLLFAAGLWLSRLGGPVGAWLAVAWATTALLLQASFYLEPLAAVRPTVDALYRVLGCAVAVALGVALLAHDPSNKRIERTPRALS